MVSEPIDHCMIAREKIVSNLTPTYFSLPSTITINIVTSFPDLVIVKLSHKLFTPL